MRKLSLSLIIVVIASIIGLGWIINKIYDHSDISLDQTAQAQQLDFFRSLARSVNNIPDKAAFISDWNSHSKQSITLVERDELPLPQSLKDSIDQGLPVLLETESGIEAYILLNSSQKLLQVSLPSPQNQTKKNRFELLLTLSFYAGITTIILIWVWPLVHQLERLRKAAIKFGQGELSTRAQKTRLSYIKDIEGEFNRMADKIESLVSDNKLLSRAVSHDLKTPLARLRFGLDALSDTDDPSRKEKYAQRVDRDLEDMESLIETLLQYARLDEAQVTLQQKEVNIASIMKSLIEKHSTDDVEIDFTNFDEQATLLADVRYLSMLFNNIISNAIKHAAARVVISAIKDLDQVNVTVEDDGPGIPASQRSDALKPFWRGDPSRDKKGHGMGLAIVARIAAWHSAELSIDQSESLGGAKVGLSFRQS